jgi:hypothetical protein
MKPFFGREAKAAVRLVAWSLAQALLAFAVVAAI